MKLHFEPNGETQLLALFGADLRQSPSPSTHTRWARGLNLNLQYTALPVKEDQEFLALTQALLNTPQFIGGNITNPFKVTSLQLSNVDIDPAARLCGAANTLYRTNGAKSSGWSLTNTDYAGCSDSLTEILRENVPTSDPITVVILGAGAMMQTYLRAIENYALLNDSRIEVHIAARLPEATVYSSLSALPPLTLNPRYIDITSPEWETRLSGETQVRRRLLCINTLPGKTSQDAEKVTLSAISGLDPLGLWTDKNLLCVTYGPQNSWQQMAVRLGWRVLNGDRLFERQARMSFKLWTGLDAPNLPAAQPPF